MRVILGTDDAHELVQVLRDALQARGYEVDLLAVTDWATVGRQVGAAVADGSADTGIVCCWTGTGVSIAANKTPGVRAALCGDVETVEGARRWNDANVLALSLRTLKATAIDALLDAWFDTPFDPAESERIASLD